MTRRYAAMFDRLKARGEGAFGAFVMLGDPDLATGAQILDRLVDAGADMLEVGIPFSDPVADGPVIQAAAERALRQGVRPRHCFELLSAFRRRHPQVPVGILTYANIVLAAGRDAFYRAAAEAGVDSVLVADVPSLEAPPFAAAAMRFGVAPVLIAAARTPRPALERIAALGRGYTYCVARNGVTGTERAMELDHAGLFEALRHLNAPPPILGFGISTPDHVRQALAAGAAGVISGSAIVSLLQENGGGIREFVAAMKQAAIHPNSERL
jgi:tryptophan synthase alpha chain